MPSKMDLEIIDLILKELHIKKTKEEKERILTMNDNLYRKKLMNEKNLSSKANEDSFNLGGFVVSKEKDSNVNIIKMTIDFRNKYLDNSEKKIYDIISSYNINTDDIGKYFVLYVTLKRDELLKKNGFILNDIFNYKIE